MDQNILSFYKDYSIQSSLKLRRFDRLINTYSFLRLFVLIAGGYGVYKSIQAENVWLTELVFFLIVIAFAWLVKKQSQFEKSKRFYSALTKVNDNEIDSITNQGNIYDDGSRWIDDSHIYTSDLDIFGKRSLFNLINRAASPQGNMKLATWLKMKASTDEVLKRQEAIRELAAKMRSIQEFKANLLFAKDSGEDEIQNLYKYLEAPIGTVKLFLKVYIQLIPLIFFSLAILAYFFTPIIIPLIIFGLLNFILVNTKSAEVNKADRLLGKAGRVLQHYAEPFRWIEEENFNSVLAKDLKFQISSGKETDFSKKIKQLSALLSRLEYRLNIFVGPVLNFTVAWDVRQLIAIQEWKQTNKIQIEKAFDVLADFEALTSLASLSSNYPDWTFPQVADEGEYTFIATQMGHPLIPANNRVRNDFELDNSLKIDIITGSNMAGKSTFLRTIGINAVLALCGAPVCADRLKLSNMHVFTYMRIKDSLNENTSTFKAELNRLKLLLESLEHHEKVYFLIDEMLRGTNSVDKYLGSKAVIEKLISKKGVGIVATHDLQIARLEDKYPAYVRNFYFDIQLNGTDMHFDYKLKHGECTTFNASQLLKQLGIEVGEA